MIANIRQFILKIESLQDQGDAFEIFEEKCTEELRTGIYKMADLDTPEPFRSAMVNMGYTEF